MARQVGTRRSSSQPSIKEHAGPAVRSLIWRGKGTYQLGTESFTEAERSKFTTHTVGTWRERHLLQGIPSAHLRRKRSRQTRCLPCRVLHRLTARWMHTCKGHTHEAPRRLVLCRSKARERGGDGGSEERGREERRTEGAAQWYSVQAEKYITEYVLYVLYRGLYHFVCEEESGPS